MSKNIIPHPAVRAAERRRRGAEAVPVGSDPEKIETAVRLAAERAARRSEKLCACCGCLTAPLVQFHGQDTGFGLCGRCSNWIENRHGPEYLAQHYGRRGIHIEGKECLTDGK